MALDVRDVIRDELGRRAPEVDFDAVDPKANLREAFDIDSMDFLNLVVGLHERLHIEIPEDDYPELETIEGAVEYLRRKVGPATAA